MNFVETGNIYANEMVVAIRTTRRMYWRRASIEDG